MLRPSPKAARLVVQGLALLFPICLWGWWTIAEPRPFYVAEDDPEAHFYFSMRLALDHQPLFDLRHPGLTAVYLLAGLSRVHDWGPSPQDLLIAARLVAAVLTGLATMAFARWAARGAGSAVTLLAICIVFSWPSFLYYFDYFGSHSLEWPIAITLLLALVRAVESPGVSRTQLATIGALMALGIATKLTFIPLVAAAVAGLAHYAIVHRRNMAWVVLGGVAASAVLFLPIWGEVPGIVLDLVRRGGFPLGIGGWEELFAANVVLAIVVVGTLLAMVVMVVRRRSVAPIDTMLVMLAIGLLYVMGSVDREGPGGLRHAAVPLLAVPFAVVVCSSRWPVWRIGEPPAAGLIVAIAGAILVPAAFQRDISRVEFIDGTLQEVRATADWLKSFDTRAGRIAVWDGSPGTLLGEASFFFYGNYRFADSVYDRELLDRFPDLAFLRLRDSFIISASEDLVVGESSGVAVATIVVPVDELDDELGLTDEAGGMEQSFIRLIETRFGKVEASKTSVSGVDWLVLNVLRAHSAEQPR